MLNLYNLTVRFGQNTVLNDVSLDVERGEVVCLLGPSGSGKSTLLRVVAGIERPAGGRVVIDGIEVSGPRTFVEPENRRVGMVFQDYALFPHLTVSDNVAFGLRGDGGAIPNLLGRLGLERFAKTYPHQLSGGESQRVALARAMAPSPRILLMDEPFSSLDSRLRDDVRRHTLDFIRESRTTTVIVTHDPDEALRIGDRVALLDHGRLVQFGTPRELYSRPASLFAARFFSDVAALPGRYHDGRLNTKLGSFPAILAEGAEAFACIRPQHLRIASHPTALCASVVSSEFCGETLQVVVKVDGLEKPVVLRAPAYDGKSALASGAIIHLEINSEDIPIVPSSPSS